MKVLDNEERTRRVGGIYLLAPHEGCAFMHVTDVQTLLHELCHVAAWLIDGELRPPHGARFWFVEQYTTLIL